MILSTLRTAFLLLATAAAALAQIDILANTDTFKPKFTVSDHYTEKVVSTVDDGFVFREVDPNPESIAISIIANLDGVSTGVINADTMVGLTVWNFSFSDNLGDAPDYKPGLKRATFPLNMDVDLANGSTRTVRVGSILYVWTAKTLTVTVTCTDIAGAGISDIAASDYAGTADPGTSLAIVNDPINTEVDFGDAIGTRNVYLNGITHTVIKGFGAPTSDDYEEYDVVDVTLQGSADVTGPTVKSTFPTKPDTLNKVTVTGTAADLTDVTLDSITVNGLTATPTSKAIADPDGDGVWNWSVTGLQLKKGANAIVLTFSDEDGNQTKVTKSYTLAK